MSASHVQAEVDAVKMTKVVAECFSKAFPFALRRVVFRGIAWEFGRLRFIGLL